jgi:hypothetical protein
MKRTAICSLCLLLIVLSGCATTTPIMVHKYDYANPPAGLAPGTPPSPPGTQSAGQNYQKIYGSGFDDPSLVIFKNDSYRTVKIDISGSGQKGPIILEAYQATPNLHLGLGDHSVRILIEKPTAAHDTWQVIQFFTISIRPEGRSQIFRIYDASSGDYDYGYSGLLW